MSNTVKTSDKHKRATCSGYKPIHDPEINIDKFKLTTVVHDTVFGIYLRMSVKPLPLGGGCKLTYILM